MRHILFQLYFFLSTSSQKLETKEKHNFYFLPSEMFLSDICQKKEFVLCSVFQDLKFGVFVLVYFKVVAELCLTVKMYFDLELPEAIPI